MDKQLGNKSALFALSKVRNTSTSGSNLCSLRQPTPSRQHPGVGQGEGRGTTPSALLARGVDPTPQRGPAPGGSPISGLTTCHPHPPCGCLLSSPQPETRGCFGEGGGGAEVNSSRDLVSEVHWADLFGQDPCGSGGSLWHKLWRNSFTAVTRKCDSCCGYSSVRGLQDQKEKSSKQKKKSSKIKRAAEFYLDASEADEGVLTGLAPGAPALAPPQLGCGFQRWGTDPA